MQIKIGSAFQPTDLVQHRNTVRTEIVLRRCVIPDLRRQKEAVVACRSLVPSPLIRGLEQLQVQESSGQALRKQCQQSMNIGEADAPGAVLLNRG